MSDATKMAVPKMDEIAARLRAHLKRMENAQSDHGSLKSKYWSVNAYVAGSRIGVTYIGYQGVCMLTKSEAWEYLCWLDAGNEGAHYNALNFNARMMAADK